MANLVAVTYNESPAVYAPGDTVTITVEYTISDTQANPNVGTMAYGPNLTVADTAGTDTPVYFEPGNGGFPGFSVVTPSTEPQQVTATLIDTPFTWVVVSNTLESFDATTGVSEWTAIFQTVLPLSS
jgi:hypothetical protein